MSIRITFTSIIVPIDVIDCSLPGGWVGFITENEPKIGDIFLHDNNLLVSYAFLPEDIDDALQYWKDYGLTPCETIDKMVHWKDLCVINERFGMNGVCSWLVFDPISLTAYKKGFEPGELALPDLSKCVGRSEFAINPDDAVQYTP
jgi:hypothetical protein